MDYNIIYKRSKPIPPIELEITPDLKVHTIPDCTVMYIKVHNLDGASTNTIELTKAQATELAEWMNYYGF